MRLPLGLAWTIPITLPVSREEADRLSIGQEVALRERQDDGTAGATLGILELAGKYACDKPREAQLVYRTIEDRHPGVARIPGSGR
jgi:sulfate adenylyltransferase